MLINMMNVLIFLLITTLVVDKTNQQQPQSQQPNIFNYRSNMMNINNRNNRLGSCSRGDCYPETGDLLIGRTKFLHASSTCGLIQPERYCVLGTTRDATKCSVCDSTEPNDLRKNNNSHSIDNIVSRKQGDRFNRWWQSENGKQNVYIQFDLEAEFAFTHIIMTFKTFRPAAMVIEKSSNFGRTWKTYGYFASNCHESFPGIATDMPKNLGDVYCETKYSSDTPSTKGEVVFRILPPTLIQSRDPYSTEIQELLKITNLRINFTKLHTFGDNLLDPREELKEKYYYAVYEMVVRGSCLCYGHASKCIPVEGVQYDSDKNGMVHGQCQCQHNTGGTNCEKCEPLFNDRPWMPARSGQTNECKQCQCHNHARSCHFDADIYESTNFTSGGVCDDCLHNTYGRNCEKCKEDFYRDPRLSIDHINTCKPCACDKLGSINDAKCDPYTDEANNLIAGRCHCKPLVGGDRCESCKDGYFNLTKENPDGCQPCACNINGTIDNRGCDKSSGKCICKRHVTGRACDQCMPGFYGLSADNPDGCSPCNCFLGGAYNASCDKETGQCNCKPNMVGRMCDKPRDGFFCPALDHFLYEAEMARKFDDPRSQDYIRSIVNSDSRKSWTGTGFVKVFEGASLEFNVDNIFKAGNYELVIRYEHTQSNDAWEDLRINIIRQDPPSDYECTDYDPQEDYKQISLPRNVNHFVVSPPVCLEANKYYKIKLDFVRLSPNVQGRDASILIDSILLVPSIEDLPSVQGELKEVLIDEFRYYGCKEAQINILKENINPNCARFFCNIGLHSDGALPCDCNPTGSKSNLCNYHGGLCLCKPNVFGTKCDRCAPGTWGFGPNGCQPCNCNSAGAKNDLCDLETGQCSCYDRIIGKDCSECQSGSWRFPTCEACNCYGNADTCNQTTGHCIDCRGQTTGSYCEKCRDGYYGDPTQGQPCKECMCPGGLYGNQFADTCYFDPRIDGVICNCKEGYTGVRCDKCAINYYGNPLERGGSCKKCECNGNIDINDPNSCDQATGKCKNCLFNTYGDHCGECKPGFYGNASNHECRPCNCDTYGTENNSAENCDSITGQCNCLPNVVGKRCDSCKPDHYGLKSGEGCSYCGCDSDGTYNNSTKCDLHTGQCSCIDSRGGRTCSECSFGYWGDPNVQCKECECLASGSVSVQCDKVNGSCFCIKGIKGYHCDECERGTTGQVPSCTPCGECFDDWTKIIVKLEDELEGLEEKASNLAVGSGSSIQDFSSEYTQLEEKLNDVKKILSLNFTDRQLKTLTEKIQNIEKQILAKRDSTKKYYDIENWTVSDRYKLLEDLKQIHNNAKLEANELTDEAMNLKESHLSGAIDSIEKAGHLSDEAEKIVFSSENSLNVEFKPILESLKNKIKSSEAHFAETENNLKDYFNNIINNLTDSMSGVFSLNKAVCGELPTETLKCTAKCGGSTCDGKCGTNTSDCDGLADVYNNVLIARQKFEDLYNKQEQVFKRILTKLRNSSNLLSNTNKDINQLLDYANKSLNMINQKKTEISELIKTIENYTLSNSQIPIKIESNSEYVINKSIPVKESELEEILKKIAELAAKINVGEIENETKDSKKSSQELLDKIEASSLKLPDLFAEINKTAELFEAENVKFEKSESEANQFASSNQKVEDDLKESKSNIENIENVLNEMQQSMNDLKNTVDLDKTSALTSAQDSLKAKVKESNVTLVRTKNSLENLRGKLDELTKKFQNLINNKDNKNSAEILESLISLQSSILNKKNSLEQKNNKIRRLENQNEEARTRINELKNTLTNLKSKAQEIQTDIKSKEKFFRSCS